GHARLLYFAGCADLQRRADYEANRPQRLHLFRRNHGPEFSRHRALPYCDVPRLQQLCRGSIHGSATNTVKRPSAPHSSPHSNYPLSVGGRPPPPRPPPLQLHERLNQTIVGNVPGSFARNIFTRPCVSSTEAGHESGPRGVQGAGFTRGEIRWSLSVWSL